MIGSNARLRRAKKNRLHADINSAIDALNWLIGARESDALPEATFEVSDETSRYRARVSELLRRQMLGDDAIPGEAAAYAELL